MAQARGGNGKKRGTNEVPAEIKQYYQSERRDRMWVVWLLSGATFVITVLIVLGLFWGGRWAYNKLRDNKNGGQATTAQQGSEEDQESAGQNDEQQPSTPGDSNASSDTNSGTSGQTGAQNQQSAPAAASNATPSTGEMPRTGPSSDE